jgi:hypothetical protein
MAVHPCNPGNAETEPHVLTISNRHTGICLIAARRQPISNNPVRFDVSSRQTVPSSRALPLRTYLRSGQAPLLPISCQQFS